MSSKSSDSQSGKGSRADDASGPSGGRDGQSGAARGRGGGRGPSGTGGTRGGPRRDPKTIVTHHAFRVDPELLGQPLAGPGRRFFGILIDLCVLGLLFPVRAAASVMLGGIMDLLVALAVAWLLFHLSSSRSEGEVPSAGVRWLLRGAALVIALVGVAGFFDSDEGGGPEETPPAAAASDSAPELPAGIAALQDLPGISGASIELDGRTVSFRDMAGGLSDVLSLTRASGPEQAQPVANRMATSLQRMGASSTEAREALVEIMASRADSATGWMQEVADRAVARIDSLEREDRLAADTILVRYARALTAADTAAAEALRPRLVAAVAGDRIAALREDNDVLEAENEELEDELEEARSTPGLVNRASTLVTDDLGIGLGWLGIYFTAFLALWGGRTPGKRLLGTRVVRLSGEPLGWWASFERFGGYAAGFATGLMGFAEILWDPNRQAIHDRIAGTVVVRTRGKQYRAWEAHARRRASRTAGGKGGGENPYEAARGPHPHLGTDR